MKLRFPTAPIFASLSVVAVLTAGCSGSSGDDAGSAPAGGDAPSAVEVDIADFAFGPPAIEVAAGGEVTWTNSDVATHTATSADGTPAAFDTGIIDRGKSASTTLDEPGEYAYICSLHPTMKATVTVVGE